MRSTFAMVLALAFCSAAQAQGPEPTVNGLMITGAVNQALGTANESGGIRFWSDYVGADLRFGAEHAAIDASGTDVIKLTDVSVNGGLLMGIPVGRVKPHVRLGFGYSYAKDEVTNAKINIFEFDPSLGIDFMAAPHLMFGIDLFSLPFVVSGDINGTDVGGHDFTFLSQVRVGYVF